MAIKLIDIDQGNTNELPGPFYCPACSKLVFGREGYGKSICNHVLFTFLSEGYEFENVNPKAKEIIEQIEKDEDVEEPIEEFAKKYQGSSAFIAGVSSGGMGCGPTGATMYVGVDFSI